MTEITAVLCTIERDDGATLHVIDRSTLNELTPFVVCWNLKMHELNHAEWDWGTYCTSLEEAVDVLRAKRKKHDFPLDDECQLHDSKHNEDGICTQCHEDICPYGDEAEVLTASSHMTMWRGGDK